MGRWLEGARAVRRAMDAAGAVLTDEQAAVAAAIFKAWSGEGVYNRGDRVRSPATGQLYRCIAPAGQAIGPNATWEPSVSPSLWARIDNPAAAWPPWVQPLGATDAYPLGAKVSHKGKRWVSATDANTWEPGVYGWTEQAA